MARGVALAAVLVLMPGCLTPIVARSGFFGVGLFHVQTPEHGEGVQHAKVTGLGVLGGHGKLTIGGIEREVLIIEPTAAGVFVQTPRVQVMTGEVAETEGQAWILGDPASGSDEHTRNQAAATAGTDSPSVVVTGDMR